MTQQFVNDCGPVSTQRLATADSETYTVTLASNEWITNVLTTVDNTSKIIYEIAFHTNWGRKTGFMGPGVPQGATTVGNSYGNPNAIDPTVFLAYINLMDVGSGKAALGLELGSCVDPAQRR